MSNISTTTKPSQLDAQHQNNNNLTSPLSPSLMFPQGNNNGQSVKANMSSGSSPLETAATCSTALGHQNGLPTASTSDLSQQQQQTIGGTDIRSLAAEKSGCFYICFAFISNVKHDTV
uniref:Uncharacterized protein n=1 Tax=Meloidogyne javanica TaxID=6303 RepID=A0A915LRI9_MELJA